MFLVAVQAFGRWLRGDAITAGEDIMHVLEHHSEKVVRVGADAAPAVSAAQPEAPHEASHEG